MGDYSFLGWRLFDYNKCGMADRTISLRPLPPNCPIERVLLEFKDFSVTRAELHAASATAYLEFSHPSQIGAIDAKYPDCRLPTLNNAEIGLV